MGQPGYACWSDSEWKGDLLAPESGAGIATGNIDHYSRPEEIFVHGSRVGTDSGLVRGAGVVEVCMNSECSVLSAGLEQQSPLTIVVNFFDPSSSRSAIHMILASLGDSSLPAGIGNGEPPDMMKQEQEGRWSCGSLYLFDTQVDVVLICNAEYCQSMY